MITEKEEQNLKMYALKILSAITKKLHLYIEVDMNKNKISKKISHEEIKEEEETTVSNINDTSISSAFEKL